MNDAKFVQLLESFGDLSDDIKRHLFIDLSCHAESFKIAAGAILHDEIDVVLGVDDLIKLDYVGMT